MREEVLAAREMTFSVVLCPAIMAGRAKGDDRNPHGHVAAGLERCWSRGVLLLLSNRAA